MPVNNKEEKIKNYCQKLVRELEQIGLRTKIFSKGKVEKRALQMYQKKIPYYLVVGEQELGNEKLKLTNTYLLRKENSAGQKTVSNQDTMIQEITVQELISKLAAENKFKTKL